MLQIIVDFGRRNIFGAEVPLRVYGYGLMLAVGFVVAILVARWRCRRSGENPEVIDVCGIIALVTGVGGARLAYIIENWHQYRTASPATLLDVTSGGLIYYGGFLLAAASVIVYLLARRLPVRRYLDIISVSLMIGLAFGRAGCLLNGCCYGRTASEDSAMAMRFPMYSQPLMKFDGRANPFPQGMSSPTQPYAHQMSADVGVVHPPEALMSGGRLIPPDDFTPEQIALAQAQRSAPTKPSQVLGLLNALVVAAVLTVFHRLRTREGQVFALLLILYPVTRVMLELIRVQPGGSVMGHNVFISAGIVAVGGAMWLWLRRLPPSAGPTWRQRLAGASN